MNYLNNFSSAAIFGSVARGDDDKLSDLDLLLVSENKAPTHELAMLRAKGFSPAVYTWDSLQSLSKYKSLFLLHLKLESKILKDDDSRLSSFLSSITVARDYSTALEQSVFLSALTSGVPDTPQLKLWASDVLAVAVRNYLVALAAEKGTFIFSYRSLIEFAEDMFSLSADAKKSLLDLRIWKAAYRTKGLPMSACPNLEQVRAAQEAFSLISGIKVVGRQCSAHGFAHQLLHSPVASEAWYHALRRYEGAYRAISSQFFGKGTAEEIEQQIAAPSCYTNDGRVFWRLLREHVLAAYAKAAH